jgi:hypothetical protein
MTVHAEINMFFQEYVDAFAREDAGAVSELWDPVGLFPSPTGNFALERPAFREHCARVMGFYRQQGVARPEGETVSVTELVPGVVQARVAYRMRDAAGGVVAGWDHVYILRKTDRWRVSVAIADEEMAAWAAKGASR